MHNIKGYEAAQRAYDRQLPPGYDEPDYDDECEDGQCGECKTCITDEAEYRAELAAEAKWETRHDR